MLDLRGSPSARLFMNRTSSPPLKLSPLLELLSGQLRPRRFVVIGGLGNPLKFRPFSESVGISREIARAVACGAQNGFQCLRIWSFVPNRHLSPILDPDTRSLNIRPRTYPA